jgi:Rrf2 family transcriptional regulator, nitric oxide-sensitive transcriptional repressor
MKLTSFTDYSLRVLIYLAAEPGRRATISEIAVAFGISENHLTKVVHFLGKQGWIATVRGKGGGMGLARPPEQIVIGQVVRSTEGSAMPAECFDQASDTCPITPVCNLKRVLQEAVEAFLLVLDGYTLADLVRNRATLARVLKIQTVAPPPSLRQ